MNELLQKFKGALSDWEDHCNCLPMIELLKPFSDSEGLDILESNQKGCDYGWIEIQGNLIAPMHDIESGEAILFLAQWLRRDDSDRVTISLSEVCEVMVVSSNDEIISEMQSPSLATAMLWMIVAEFTPEDPGE